MTDLEPCPFCGGTNTKVFYQNNHSSKTATVRCHHCAAQGSVFLDLVLEDGTFEQTKRQLQQQAKDAWNGKHTNRGY